MAGNSADQPKKRRGPGKPFAKGQSGNPSGVSKEAVELRAMFRQGVPEAFARIMDLLRTGEPEDVRFAIGKILDFGLSKPAQEVDMTQGHRDEAGDFKSRTTEELIQILQAGASH